MRIHPTVRVCLFGCTMKTTVIPANAIYSDSVVYISFLEQQASHELREINIFCRRALCQPLYAIQETLSRFGWDLLENWISDRFCNITNVSTLVNLNSWGNIAKAQIMTYIKSFWIPDRNPQKVLKYLLRKILSRFIIMADEYCKQLFYIMYK